MRLWCANHDHSLHDHLREELFFILQSLTYRVTSYTTDLTTQEVDNTIRTGLNKWANVTPLTFKKATTGIADIEISFDKSEDRDYSFDGPGGELAYAYFPLNNVGKNHYENKLSRVLMDLPF